MLTVIVIGDVVLLLVFQIAAADATAGAAAAAAHMPKEKDFFNTNSSHDADQFRWELCYERLCFFFQLIVIVFSSFQFQSVCNDKCVYFFICK